MNKKYLFSLLLIILLCFIVPVKALLYENESTNYQLIIEDDAHLLNDNEINKLEDKMKPLTEYGNIAFKSIDSNNLSTSVFAANYYHEKFQNKSGTLFLIDMDHRIIYIFSDGDNYKVITDSKADIITDNVYKYASRSDYYKCAYEAFDEINILLDGGKIAEPMRYISNGLIAITISFLVSFLIVMYNTRIKKASVSKIIKNSKVNFKVANIKGSKSGTHRKYSPVDRGNGGSHSSSGGSSGGGSFGGGGFSSGGGGGHRF